MSLSIIIPTLDEERCIISATSNLARGKAQITFRYIKGMLQEALLGKYYNYNIKPEWYER